MKIKSSLPLLCFIIILLPSIQFIDASNNVSGLEDKLREVDTIMWFGAHPDDELYTGGTFGYYTRDLGGHLIIVSLYYNPGYVESNIESAEFLGNATYIRIEEQLGVKLPKCRKWVQLDEIIRELEREGVKDYIKQLILDYKPGIIFGFESTNGFRYSCQHVTMAKLLDEAVKELKKEGYDFFSYYYILNRDPNWFGEEKMDPLPVTDIIDLTDEMWSYKLTLFDIYSKFYPDLKNETKINSLEHKEYFRRVEIKQISSEKDIFPKGSYVKAKIGRSIPTSLLENDGITGFLLDVSWNKLEPEEGVYNWESLDARINEATSHGKYIFLNIMAGGVNTPNWVINKSETYTFIDTNRYHRSYLENITIPVFWNETFLNAKKEFIQTLGERYSNNPYIVAVTVSFANAMTNDWFIPHFIGTIKGREINQVEDWLKVGYTHEKMLNAGIETIDTWANAFPYQILKLPLGLTHEDLDGSKTRLAEDICEYAYRTYPDRFYIQINALCPNIPSPDELSNIVEGEPLYLLRILLEHTPNIGLQLLAAASNGYKDDCRLNNGEYPCYPSMVLLETLERGLMYNPSYIEYWEEDGENNQLEDLIGYATDAMRDNLAVYIKKPIGLCIFDQQFFPMETPIIVGYVTIGPSIYPSSVDRVEFYVDDTLLYTDYEKPYQWKLEVKPGLHKLSVRVYDNDKVSEAEIDVLYI